MRKMSFFSTFYQILLYILFILSPPFFFSYYFFSLLLFSSHFLFFLLISFLFFYFTSLSHSNIRRNVFQKQLRTCKEYSPVFMGSLEISVDRCKGNMHRYVIISYLIVDWSTISYHITSYHIIFSSDTLCTVLHMYSIFILWYGKLNDIIALIGSP